jgi:hypothetical protein
MKVLRMGSTGQAVRQLQGWLNLIPGSKLAALVVDGIYGLKTTGRVREFQGQNKLVADGEAGPLTLGVVEELLKALLGGPPVDSQVVRPITKEILGMEGPQNLIDQIIPPIAIIAEAGYRKNDDKNLLQFSSTAGTVARLGIFAAKKNGVERAVILLLPKTATPETTLVCITQGFAQSPAVEALGWANPLSAPHIQYCLLKHVVNRWGAQMLASRKKMALVYIVRAKGDELGPFATDGAFLKQVLGEMAKLTGNAFGFGKVEAMTFSSGIYDFNRFLPGLVGQVNLTQVYSIDPAGPIAVAAPAGVGRREFLRTQTGLMGPSYDYLPLGRWVNEWSYPIRQTFKHPWPFHYLHNHCMPMYTLYLGLQTS